MRNKSYPDASGRIIQGLWIGQRLSTMERLCISSFQRHGHLFHLYVYQETEGVPPGTVLCDGNEILPASAIFTYREYPTYAGFANFFRYKLLLENGGWFVDLDTICLKPFQFTADYVFSSQHREGQVDVNLAAMRVPPDSAVIRRAWESCLAMDRHNLQWGQSGPYLMTRAVEQEGLSRYVLSPETFCPVAFAEWEKVLATGPCWEPGADPYAIHLWNELWRRAGQDKDASYDAGCLYEQLKKAYLLSP